MSGLVITQEATFEFKAGFAAFRAPDGGSQSFVKGVLLRERKNWKVVEAFFPALPTFGTFVGMRFEDAPRGRGVSVPGAGGEEGNWDFLLMYCPKKQGYSLVESLKPYNISFEAHIPSGIRVSNPAGTLGLQPGDGWYIILRSLV